MAVSDLTGTCWTKAYFGLQTALCRWDLWQPGLGIVDFTNPEARIWYASKLEALIDLGVDTFKVRGFLIDAVKGAIETGLGVIRLISERGFRTQMSCFTMDLTPCVFTTHIPSCTMNLSSTF